MLFYSDLNQQDNLVDDKVYNLESIYQSIHNIINTEKGQRLFLPEFGIDLWKFLFEPMTDEIVMEVYMEVYDALEYWEPRIKILDESNYVANYENHTIELTIVFEIKGKLEEKYIYQTVLSNKQKESFYEI